MKKANVCQESHSGIRTGNPIHQTLSHNHQTKACLLIPSYNCSCCYPTIHPHYAENAETQLKFGAHVKQGYGDVVHVRVCLCNYFLKIHVVSYMLKGRYQLLQHADNFIYILIFMHTYTCIYIYTPSKECLLDRSVVQVCVVFFSECPPQ